MKKPLPIQSNVYSQVSRANRTTICNLFGICFRSVLQMLHGCSRSIEMCDLAKMLWTMNGRSQRHISSFRDWYARTRDSCASGMKSIIPYLIYNGFAKTPQRIGKERLLYL